MESLVDWTAVIAAMITGGATLLVAQMWIKQSKAEFARGTALEDQAEKTAKAMLSHPTLVERSFRAIAKKIGFQSEKEVRDTLGRLGATPEKRKGGEEWWHLRTRETEMINTHRDRKKRPRYCAPD